MTTVSKAKQYEYNGETHTIREWAKIYGMKDHTLRDRLRRMSLEMALTAPMNHGFTEGAKRRNGTYYEIDGVSHTVREWAEIYKINPQNIYNRIAKGMDPVTAITMPKSGRRRTMYEWHGKMMDVEDLAKIGGVSETAIRERLKNGWDIEDAVTKPTKARTATRERYRKNKKPKQAHTCDRYDCLHQDGSGVCQLGFSNSYKCDGSYKDAFEYYYNETERRNKRRERKNDGNNGLRYFGTGSAYVNSGNAAKREKADPWAKDRKLLCSSYVPD